MNHRETPNFGRRYSDLRSLGSGAQGVVFVGKDRFLSGNKVAIKALHLGVDGKWRGAFINEFETLAGLSHPRLARVHDFGATLDGRVYFTRDFVEGEDLHIAAANADGKTLLNILIEVCRALKPLHGRGLLHGDLKPGNIIVSDKGVAHLIDFSFVCLSGEDAKRQGTVQYMAPEVIEGKPVDPRADLYALGMTMIDILFGKPLFTGKVSEIVASHLGESRPELNPKKTVIKDSRSDSRILGMVQIAKKLVSRFPDDRFPDVWEVEAALTALSKDGGPPLPVASTSVREHPVVSDSFGRAGEFERIRLAVAQKLDSPKDNETLKVVLGEFGTGKQALLRNVKWWAQRSGIAVVEARSVSSLLEPVAGLVNQALDHVHSDARNFNLGDYLVGQLSKPDVAVTNIDQLTREVANFFLDLSRMGPLLIEVGNLDVASFETLHVLAGLLAQVDPSLPVAVLVTAEPTFSWREKLGAGDVFTLPVLDSEQVSKVARAFLGKADPKVVDRIVAHTGGNPIFVETLLKDLAANGAGAERLEQLGPPGQLEAYWREGLAKLLPKERQVLFASAVIDRAAGLDEIAHVAGLKEDGLETLAADLESAGWLRRGVDGWYVATSPIAREVIFALDRKTFRKKHEAAAQIEKSEAKRLLHGARGGMVRDVEKRGLEVALSLEKMGALHGAVELLLALEGVVEDEPELRAIRLGAGRVHLAQGNYEAALSYLKPLARGKRSPSQSEALLHLGAIHSVFGRLDESVKCLEATLAIESSPSDKARALRELSNVEFKRGNLPACVDTAKRGLACAPERDTVRADLLMVLAKKSAHEGHHGDALQRAKQAVEAARRTGDRTSLASAVDMHAWVLGQSGDLNRAIEALEQAAMLYRELGNLPKLMRDQLALGDMLWRIEKWSEALDRYEEASRLTAGVSNPIESLLVEIGLGQALIKTGRFERAGLIIGRAKSEAKRLGEEELLMHTLVYEGDLLAYRGDVGDGLEKYREAHRGFEKLLGPKGDGERENKKGGWTRWQAALADLELELAGWLLWRGGPTDRDEAERLIETAEQRDREDRGRSFKENLALRKAVFAISGGRVEDGMNLLDGICNDSGASPIRDIRWQANLAAAKGYIKMKADFLARRRLRQAETDLEALANLFTAQQQLAFWQDVRRAEVRQLLETTAPSSDFSSSMLAERDGAKLDAETRALYRILEFNRQLSKEHELPRLLSAILEAAVELTGAERGVFLMASSGGDGPLQIQAAKQMDIDDSEDPHGRFSRSIAESVHLDGEPVVTIDAMGDERFNEFISIHELKMRSVACVPVRYRDEGLGVLYLENRLKAGRFGGSDLRVLMAFSDQVAIAIAQTRMLEDAKKRELEIREARQTIERAFDEQTENLNAKDTDLKLARERLDRLREVVHGQGNYHGAVGTSEPMTRVFSMVERVKDLNVPVVLVGESGTGKDLLARILHEEGARRDHPFVVLNCGSVPETLMESTLFGHKKGTFSGASSDQPGILASAGGGTLYLDEIGDMSPRMQVDLLRVVQEERFTPLGASETVDVDLRLVASSKTPLAELVETGRLRSELLYRLQVVTVEIPPLRQRTDDLLPLARQIIEREAGQSNLPLRSLSKGAADAIYSHPWPGNVRELEQALRRAIIIGDDTGPISARELGIETGGPRARSTPTDPIHPDAFPMDEKERITLALNRCRWNRTRAAKELGIPRRTFYRKLDKLGIVKKK